MASALPAIMEADDPKDNHPKSVIVGRRVRGSQTSNLAMLASTFATQQFV